jgi:hypothetical protein
MRLRAYPFSGEFVEAAGCGAPRRLGNGCDNAMTVPATLANRREPARPLFRSKGAATCASGIANLCAQALSRGVMKSSADAWLHRGGASGRHHARHPNCPPFAVPFGTLFNQALGVRPRAVRLAATLAVQKPTNPAVLLRSLPAGLTSAEEDGEPSFWRVRLWIRTPVCAGLPERLCDVFHSPVVAQSNRHESEACRMSDPCAFIPPTQPHHAAPPAGGHPGTELPLRRCHFDLLLECGRSNACDAPHRCRVLDGRVPLAPPPSGRQAAAFAGPGLVYALHAADGDRVFLGTRRMRVGSTRGRHRRFTELPGYWVPLEHTAAGGLTLPRGATEVSLGMRASQARRRVCRGICSKPCRCAQASRCCGFGRRWALLSPVQTALNHPAATASSKP